MINEPTNSNIELLLKCTIKFGKLNELIAKMKNPYLLTYIIEGLDSINSNEIENIHTTIDEANNELNEKNDQSPYVRYRETLKTAHKRLQHSKIITNKDIIWINDNLRATSIKSYRKTPATIKDSNGNILHQGIPANEIIDHMNDVLDGVNAEPNYLSVIEALKIHHKFEWIHPFSDGNGRTGRILFALLLNKFDVLTTPVSFFSYSINQRKSDYYKALKYADNNEYNKYYDIMLELLNESLIKTIEFAKTYFATLNNIIENNEDIVNNKKFQDVLEWCFAGVKVSNEFICKKTNLNNKTVSKYVKILEDLNIIKIEYNGKYRPYKNLVVEKLIHNIFQMK